MIATETIQNGLDLNIERVIFTSIKNLSFNDKDKF